jgi:hypothetical protein
VAAIARGVKLLSVAYLVLFVMLILAVGGAMQGHDWVLFGFLFIAGLMQLAGAWILASSSRHWSEPRSTAVRALLRFTSPLLPLGALGVISLTFDYREFVAGASMALLALSLATPIAAFLRIRTVARMIADADLMEHSTFVGGGFVGSVLAGLALYLYMGFSDPPPSTGVTVVLFGVVIFLLLFLLWGAFLMFCCIIDFGQAARIALADWRDDEEPT